MIDITDRLTDAFGTDRVRCRAPLAPLTTFKVGGPADWLVDVQHAVDLERAIAIAREARIPITVLGGGSNVLVSDAGVRGIVVRVHGGEVREIDASTDPGRRRRHDQRAGAMDRESWCGWNRSMGGNAGNGRRCSVWQRALQRPLDQRTHRARCGWSRSMAPCRTCLALRWDSRTTTVVCIARMRSSSRRTSRCRQVSQPSLRETARESLAFRKRTQPLESPSAGCIFQNPDPPRERVPDGIPPSAGALVDRAGLKGAREGSARVSTTHANFIVNEGGATARDIRALIDRCKSEVQTQFGVVLREEIVCLGEGD